MTDFERASLEAANAFLQTVVLLDDRAAFVDPAGGVADLGDLVGEAPLADPDDPTAPPSPATAAQPGPKTLAELPGGGLNAGLITKGFAAQGLVCAVLRPFPGNTIEIETLKVAERADIVVLDWEMGDTGAKATEIIKHLHANDQKAGERLRLISIYTGHSPLTNVYMSLKKDIPGFDAPQGMKASDLVMESGTKTTRIVLLSKSESPNAPHEKGFAVSEVELPGKLIEQFAEFTGGLLPNATLASIAALRRHTHRMLARLDKSMDGPLITHRILVGNAGDSDEFVSGVILEEMESQVPLSQIVRDYTGLDSIKAYFEHRMGRTPKPLKPQIPLLKEVAKKEDLTLEEVKGVVEHGLPALKDKLDNVRAANKPEKTADDAEIEKSFHKRLYFLTGPEDALRRNEHERFALITGMRRDVPSVLEGNAETHPIMKLGAVLRAKGQYWVCITPVCDCVRIDDAGGSFLLAELKVSKKNWNVIVQAGGNLVKLLVDRKRQTVKSVVFGPARKGLVRPVFEENQILFREAGQEPANIEAYEWLGEMKPMQAQRIVQNFASNIARVGLDEFEWQRRQAPPI